MSRRVLVIHPGALGDVLQAVPALRALGGADAVTFCGQARFGALLSGLGEVRESVFFDGFGLEALFTREPPAPRVRDELARFDDVVSWFGASDACYPARLRELARVRTLAAPVPPDTSASTVWRYLLETVGADADGAREPFHVPGGWRDAARVALRALGASPPFLLVHPGAGGKSKLVPPPMLAGIISAAIARRPVQIVVHQGPADRDAADALIDLLGAPAHRLADPDLPMLTAVASLATTYLGGDSGVSHLAASAGAPAVIVFPAATRRQWAPWSRTARVIRVEDEHAIERAAHALVEAPDLSAEPGDRAAQ